ncbi:MAG TPA: alpha/beta hydrolase [Verrucomicrobiae bacterium]|nr:alpha/beta hydrolase [Verrucomicrobiae bacterium]
MKFLLAVIGLIVSTSASNAQTNLTFPLWPNGAPGALGKDAKDIPTLTVFPADSDKATGAAMVICPGGGYGHLADHEGSHYARWFNEQGITGFVLKYRLGPAGYRHPAMLQDAARAVRTVRARAPEWKLDPKRVGIIGSSAGGHLASTLMTHWDLGDSNSVDVIEKQSSRPDLAILCYAVISMQQDFTHKGSRANLLGTNPPPELLKELSAELQVNSNTPPCFIWSTADDKTVPVENSLDLAKALRRAKVPFDLHVYASGPHGLGLGNRSFDKSNFHPWTTDCERWLKQNGFAK